MNRHRFVLGVIGFVGALGLASCGGGSGGSYTAPAPEPKISVRIAALQSAQEVPPVTAIGLGSASFSLNENTRELTGSVSTTGVAGTAAHIHDGVAGANGAIVVPLVAGATAGSWVVPPSTILATDLVPKFLAGGLYVNVHSAANPGGEIRGQIGALVKHARINAGQAGAGITSTGSGWAWISMQLNTGELSGTVTLSGVTPVGVTMNAGAVGAGGPAVLQLTGGPTTYTVPAGTRLADPLYSAFLGNQLYFNVLTAANPTGELRGQVDSVVKVATLSGAQEVPPNSSTATGTGIVMMNPATRGVAAVVQTNLTIATAAHIHNANAGVNGGVIVGFTSPAPGVWGPAPTATFTEDQAARFFQQGLYFNVHSAAFPGGEIRAQIVANPG